MSRAPRRARPSCRVRGRRSRRSCPTAVGVGLKGRGCRTSVVGRRGQRGRICLASVVGRRGPTLVVGRRGPTSAVGRVRRGPTLAVGRVRRGRICQALAVARDPRGRTLAVEPKGPKGPDFGGGPGFNGPALRGPGDVRHAFTLGGPPAGARIDVPGALRVPRDLRPDFGLNVHGPGRLNPDAHINFRWPGGPRRVCAGISTSACLGWPVPADTSISTSTGPGRGECLVISAQVSTGGWRLPTYASSSVSVTSSISAPTGEDCAFV